MTARLATSGWQPAELPERATASTASHEDRPGPPGALAEIGFRIGNAATARPGEINVILYGVFDRPAHAQAAFARGPQAMVNPADHTNFGRKPAPGFTGPAALFHLEVTDIHGSGTPVMGYSYCTLLHGTIMISGGSGIPGTTAHGDDRHACTLADDALSHLQRLS